MSLRSIGGVFVFVVVFFKIWCVWSKLIRKIFYTIYIWSVLCVFSFQFVRHGKNDIPKFH